MSKSVRRVERAAMVLGLDVEFRRMGGSTRTAADAARACGCDLAQIVKSLIFRGRESGAMVLLLVSGANRVDMDQAAEAVGEPLDRADATEVRARTGFAIGGVSPVGHLEAPRIWMDRDLMAFDMVWAAAGAPDAVFSVAPERLQTATGRRSANWACGKTSLGSGRYRSCITRLLEQALSATIHAIRTQRASVRSREDALVAELRRLAPLGAAEIEAARGSGTLADRLLAAGLVEPTVMAEALARAFDLPIAPGGWTPDPALSDRLPRTVSHARRVIDVRGPNGAILRVTCDPARSAAASGGRPTAVVDAVSFEAAFRVTYAEGLAQAATTRTPAAFSARTLGPARHAMTGAFLAITIGAVTAAESAFFLLLGLILLVTATTTATRLMALLVRPAKAADLPLPPVLPPRIDILVPLFREAQVLGRLIAGLERLDYPRDRLCVRLLLEENDTETAAALARIKLPHWIRPLMVPRGEPRTKPRAMNVALDFCEGEIVGILDAEDRPDPRQLLHIAGHFSRADTSVAAVQCQLAYFNARENWITRCFQIEYAIWFDVLMRGWQKLGLPLPLGGTSVYFRRATLEQLGGWDAHNVTEDADLGMRIARAGLRTDVIGSTTDEEANCRWRPWIRQRSRWLKGYMMTWLCHMARPGRLFRDLGPTGFLGFQVLFLGSVVSYLAIPLFWLAAGVSFLSGESIIGGGAPGWAVWGIGAICASGQIVMLLAAVLALHRRRARDLIGWVPLMPVYWSMGALAAWRAIAELAVAPYFWDKTDHGITRLAPADDTIPDVAEGPSGSEPAS